MAQVDYLVCNRDGRWTLLHEGRQVGHYDTMEIAQSVAIDAAQGAGLQGAEAAVRVEASNGSPRTVWIHGRDPYPGPLKEPSKAEFR